MIILASCLSSNAIQRDECRLCFGLVSHFDPWPSRYFQSLHSIKIPIVCVVRDNVMDYHGLHAQPIL